MQLFGPGLVLACAGVILGASAGYSQSLDPAPIYNGSPLVLLRHKTGVYLRATGTSH